MKRRWLVGGLAAILLLLIWTGGRRHVRISREPGAAARHVIILIGDGFGAKHLEAAEKFRRSPAPFSGWPRTWSATCAARGSYDPHLAWSDFDYAAEGATDSAAAATAMFTGHKTGNGRISVSADASDRLMTLAETARRQGMAAGVVTSVEISDATSGAWMAHNDRRSNGFAIADEGLWGDPGATGGLRDSPFYGGGHGPTEPPMDVVIGCGHPDWDGRHFVNGAIRNKLARESGLSGAFLYLERRIGEGEAGARLLSAAAKPSTTRLAGLYGGPGGRLDYRLADGSGANPENPTLAEMTRAALAVLGRAPEGFVLLVEGGAIDDAAHDGFMDQMLGEALDFFDAVQAVADWIDDPESDATWDNTLVVVTADHETGYLTAGPDVFPDRPLGTADARTLSLEKGVSGTGLRASWEDGNRNDRIDPGESVHWCWNLTGHTNSLVPLFARGAGETLVGVFVSGRDPVRGDFIQNTDLFRLVECVLGPARR